ncbi:MAG: hypothetical protein PWP23_2903 [Candidatus Sumerlaeota bacterium]|nr:hypothetical protein [Candidatus Sumerlaeota bacterium]
MIPCPPLVRLGVALVLLAGLLAVGQPALARPTIVFQSASGCETPLGFARFTSPSEEGKQGLRVGEALVFETPEGYLRGDIVAFGETIVFTISRETGFLARRSTILKYENGMVTELLADRGYCFFHDANAARSLILVESRPEEWERIKNDTAPDKLIREVLVLSAVDGSIVATTRVAGFSSLNARWELDGESVLLSGDRFAAMPKSPLLRWTPGSGKFESLVPDGHTVSDFDVLPGGRVAATLAWRENGALIWGLFVAGPRPDSPIQRLDPDGTGGYDIAFDPATGTLAYNVNLGRHSPSEKRTLTLAEIEANLARKLPVVASAAPMSTELGKAGERALLRRGNAQGVEQLVAVEAGKAETILLENKREIALAGVSPAGDVLVSALPITGEDSPGRQLLFFRRGETTPTEVMRFRNYEPPKVEWSKDGQTALLKDNVSLTQLDIVSGRTQVLVPSQVFETVALPGGRMAFVGPGIMRNGKIERGIFVTNPADPANPVLVVPNEIPATLGYDAAAKTITYGVRTAKGIEQKSAAVPPAP